MLRTSNGTLAGAWLIQARRFASRSSTRQTTHLNSDKKVSSKPSEMGRSPLNRLANRPIILRSPAWRHILSFIPFISSECFRSVLFRAAFSMRRPFLCSKTPFSVLFEYDFTPWKRQKNHIGHLPMLQETTISYKNHKRQAKDRSEWVITYNNHEPIISQELRAKVHAEWNP